MLKRLTEKQYEVFLLIQNNKGMSIRNMGKKLGVSHAAIFERIYYLVVKGYIVNVDGKYRTTTEGRHQIINDGLHNRFIKSKE